MDDTRVGEGAGHLVAPISKRGTVFVDLVTRNPNNWYRRRNCAALRLRGAHHANGLMAHLVADLVLMFILKLGHAASS
jgi:hypothetical protein